MQMPCLEARVKSGRIIPVSPNNTLLCTCSSSPPLRRQLDIASIRRLPESEMEEALHLHMPRISGSTLACARTRVSTLHERSCTNRLAPTAEPCTNASSSAPLHSHLSALNKLHLSGAYIWLRLYHSHLFESLDHSHLSALTSFTSVCA